jgi:hypothetical protein
MYFSIFALYFYYSINNVYSNPSVFKTIYDTLQFIDTVSGAHDAYNKVLSIFEKKPPKYIHELVDHEPFRALAKDYCMAIVIAESNNAKWKLADHKMDVMNLRHTEENIFKSEIQFNTEGIIFNSSRKGTCTMIVDPTGKIYKYAFLDNVK